MRQHFDETMRPLTIEAERLMVLFGRWIVAELHERGVNTAGFGKVDPRWRLPRFDYGKEDLQRSLTAEALAYLLARVFFYGKPRTMQDADLCLQTALLAQLYGLIGKGGQHGLPR